MLNTAKLKLLLFLLAHLLGIFVTSEDFFEQSCMVDAIDDKHSVNEFDRKMHSFFSLKITVADIKDLGHHAWTLLNYDG